VRTLAIVFLLGACGGDSETGGPVPGGGGNLENCQIFPADNWWNLDISGSPVDPNSDAYIDSMGADDPLHADYGVEYGIPFVVVDGDTPRSSVSFRYDDESDVGPYPIPDEVPIESGGDRHILMIETDECKLYEIFAAVEEDGEWSGGSGAIFDLDSNARRPDGWTSADAAGLAIFPGLVRYDEVAAGEIKHAIRMTASRTRSTYVWPASHAASDITDPDVPPMGMRVRLKADVDISDLSPEAQVVARALKKYGAILADNGSDWYLTGAPDPRWDDDAAADIRQLHGRDFEVVAPER
jgi:hypothetical protein